MSDAFQRFAFQGNAFQFDDGNTARSGVARLQLIEYYEAEALADEARRAYIEAELEKVRKAEEGQSVLLARKDVDAAIARAKRKQVMPEGSGPAPEVQVPLPQLPAPIAALNVQRAAETTAPGTSVIIADTAKHQEESRRRARRLAQQKAALRLLLEKGYL